MPRRGLAVLGGSFDPPHQSHLRIAAQALDQLPVQRLLAIPSGDHPHKQGRDMAPAEHRLQMARLAFAELPDVHVDDRELRRDGLSYTVDTLAELAAEHPDTRLFFLIGSDNLPLLPSWHQHHRLLQLATVVTWPRLGYPIDGDTLAGLDLTPDERRHLLAHVLALRADDISASELRARLRAGGARPSELSPLVFDYTQRHDLYR
ncbi:MAG: nicotinate (nicotinamide) nucleotide adenylyltransferase [Planctomycetes bacterium]|nr:nicotinate (nicotinamide) nucleotide adenylyltransferase [Planctomycetota bacterium]